MSRVNKHVLLASLAVVFIAAVAVLVLTNARAQMCKWVDENGVVHYAQSCPEGVETEQVKISKPTQTGAEPGSKINPFTGGDPDANARTLSLGKLGARLDNTKSKFLETTTAFVRTDISSLGGQFIIRLNATSQRLRCLTQRY